MFVYDKGVSEFGHKKRSCRQAGPKLQAESFRLMLIVAAK